MAMSVPVYCYCIIYVLSYSKLGPGIMLYFVYYIYFVEFCNLGSEYNVELLFVITSKYVSLILFLYSLANFCILTGFRTVYRHYSFIH